MSVTALLVSQDVCVQGLISSLLFDFRIETEILTDTVTARSLLQRVKFAAVIVDCDLIGAEILLEELGSSAVNKSAISFAISGPGSSANGLPHASFVLAKPLQRTATRSTLRIASSLILSSYRRVFRCSLDVAISLAGTRDDFRTRTSNISMGGIAIQTPYKLSPEEAFVLQFLLPDQAHIHTNGKVVWAEGRRAALLFIGMGKPSTSALSHWIDIEIQQTGTPEIGAPNRGLQLLRH